MSWRMATSARSAYTASTAMAPFSGFLPQPSRPAQHLAEQLLGRIGLGPEPLHESLDRVPRDPDGTVIALAGGSMVGLKESWWNRIRRCQSPSPRVLTGVFRGRYDYLIEESRVV